MFTFGTAMDVRLKDPRPQRNDRFAFVALVSVVFVYVLLRAALIPLVHDEATSFLAYAQSGRFLPFSSMWDANNHYLNSLLGWLGYKVFGLHLLALRWGSVLAFALFAWSTWKLGAFIQHRFVRWVFWSAMLGCPFLLDFFSLFRGYGPAFAFLLFGMYELLCFVRDGRTAQLVRVLCAWAIANGFLLALLPLWGVMLGVLLIATYRNRTQRALWFIAGLLPFAAALLLALRLARLGLLYQGSTEGFVEVTVVSLLQRMFGAGSITLAVVIVAMIALVTAIVLRSAIRARGWRSPAFLIAVLLWGEALGRIIAANVFGINYAEDRTALHTLLLTIVFATFAVDGWRMHGRMAWVFALPLLILPLRAAWTADLDHTVLWPEQSIPDRFVRRVQELERTLGRPPVVGTHRHAGLPWSLQYRMLGSESDANAHSWPHGMDDVRIVVPSVLKEAISGFSVVDSAPGNLLLLLLRDPPLRTDVVFDTTFTLSSNGSDRSLPIALPAEQLRGSDLLVEVEGRLSADAHPVDLRLSFAVSDSSDAIVYGDFVFLNTRRAQWNGEHWQSIRHIPQQPRAAKAVLFLWTPDSADYQWKEGRIIVRVPHP